LHGVTVCCSVTPPATALVHRCSLLQCVAVYVAVCCSALQHMLQGMMQYVVVCCRVLQFVAVCCRALQCHHTRNCQRPSLQGEQCVAVYVAVYVAVRCSMLQCVAVSVHLQLPESFVAVSCSVCCSVRYSLCCSVCCRAYCSILQYVAVSCSVTTPATARVHHCTVCCSVCCSVRDSVCCSVCCSILQGVAVCCSVTRPATARVPPAHPRRDYAPHHPPPSQVHDHVERERLNGPAQSPTHTNIQTYKQTQTQTIFRFLGDIGWLRLVGSLK